MATYNANVYPPNYIPPSHQFVPAPEVHKIRDWLPWSIISLIIGWGLGGVLPLIFSIICRSRKRTNDYEGARTMSTLALVFNIIITICGILAWIGFIIGLIFYVRAVNDVVNNSNY